MKQEKFQTGMYIIDKDFKIVNVNDTLLEFYPHVKIGEYCYKSLAVSDKQCDICPLKTDNALFYNPIRREWIFANAAEINYPGCGKCYNVQFQLRQRIEDAGSETLQNENMDEHITELSGGNKDACALGGYCEPGSPLSYANKSLLDLLGYESVESFSRDIDGLVSNTIHPDDMERVTKDLTKCAQHGGSFETTYRMRKKDNTWFWIVSRGKRVKTQSGIYALLCVITDMTEFVQRQSEMSRQNEHLLQKELTSRALLEHMPGGYHRCAKADGWPFIYFGTSFEEITGWTREEIENDFGNLFVNMVYDEDIPLCAGIIEDIEKNGYSNAIYRIKKKGGGYIWVSDSTMIVEIGDDVFYHGVLADVSRQIEEMEEAKRVAEASSLAKSSFLFNASHDIRTPMNAIQGFAHIIDDNTEEGTVCKDAIRKIIQSGKTLMTLINDVLDLSRIERGKDFANEQPIDINAHAEKLYEMFASEMKESGIKFEMNNFIEHPNVLGDDLKLTRIAMNILSNAKKFTPAGGEVTFGIKEESFNGNEAIYKLYVRDTGIGMSEQFQKRAFEQFEREHSSTESGISGSGLGLAIIKRLCDLMNGKCEIKSKIGMGTEVTVSIPMKITTENIVNNKQDIQNADFSGRRVLIVEDNDFNREIARYVFSEVGFEVDEAKNGVECLDKFADAQAGYYDLILMDIQMPLMDGYTAAKEIRNSGDTAKSNIPIVAMTANAFEEDRERCFAAGMDGHIGKPLDAHTVIEELKRVLAI